MPAANVDVDSLWPPTNQTQEFRSIKVKVNVHGSRFKVRKVEPDRLTTLSKKMVSNTFFDLVFRGGATSGKGATHLCIPIFVVLVCSR